jgi:hypothetical protein
MGWIFLAVVVLFSTVAMMLKKHGVVGDRGDYGQRLKS